MLLRPYWHLTHLFRLGALGKVYIVHHRNAILSEQVDSPFYPVTDGVRHQCVDGTSEDKVAINALCFNEFLHRGKILRLKFRALSGCLDAMGDGKTSGSIIGVWFELAAYRQVSLSEQCKN